MTHSSRGNGRIPDRFTGHSRVVPEPCRSPGFQPWPGSLRIDFDRRRVPISVLPGIVADVTRPLSELDAPCLARHARHMFRSGLRMLALVTLLGACSTGGGGGGSHPGANRSSAPVDTQGPASGRPLIIDTDMAADDWMAILFLLWRRDIRVEAITVTDAGEAHCGPGVTNALGLVALAGRPEIPVACGREVPLAGTHAFPGEWRAGVDQLLGLTLPANANKAASGSAVELLAATLRASTEKVTILTLGPLTNPAQLLGDSPDLKDRIAAVFVMGGAVDVPGNVLLPDLPPQPVAEWNVYVDPTAARLVLGSSVPVTLVPLDATNHVPITTAFANGYRSGATTASARFTGDVLAKLGDSIARGDYFFWDPFAAAVVADESVASFGRRHLNVVTDEGPGVGQIVVAAQGPEARYALSADPSRYEDLFLRTLNGRPG
ncbi:MAG TPA: nucleoside hydrolase [Candidatus Limnocylindrales bacterium]